jgi:hypothetical protein
MSIQFVRLDEELRKLAQGRPTKVPAKIVLHDAAGLLAKFCHAAQQAPKGAGKHATKAGRNDSIRFLEKLWKLDDPREHAV